MYTLKITDENTVVTTVKESIVERSNYVDKIQIVTSKMYREQIDMSDTTVYMKYKLPVSDKIKMTQLIINNLEYEQNYIQYLIPVDAALTDVYKRQALGSGNFRVDSNGKLYANSGTFSGTIYADGGTIGGWNISANSLSNRDGSISLNPDGLKLGNQLNVDNQGNATFGGKLSAATGSRCV